MTTKGGNENRGGRQAPVQGGIDGKKEDSQVTKKVAMVSLGCAKNLVNSEQMMFLLDNAGYAITSETDGADVVVVNTCGFIDSAKSEAIETILEFGSAKSDGRIGRLVVAGCLAERYKDEIMSEMPEIDAVIGVGSYDDIISAVEPEKGTQERTKLFGNINAPVSETRRILTTSPVWAYLKIAEGCDNRCGFCVIPDIRGNFRSRPIENIIREAQELVVNGIEELIVVAQDVTRYGLDLYAKRSLAELLTELSKISRLRWIRLHYLYPDEVDHELIEVIAQNDKILKYLDIPIQHINDEILANMNRRGTGGEIRDLLRSLRERLPGVVIRTSIITGLPGEGEKEFEELCAFLREVRLERAGVFAYSPQENTAASLMERPDPDTAERRARQLEDIQLRIMDEFNESRIGSETTVLIEGYSDGRFFGRSYAESPDVDGYIWVSGKNIAVNEFVSVRLTGADNDGLAGEVI